MIKHLRILLLFFMGQMANGEQLTLRLMVWEGYAPPELRTLFIKEMKQKHGIDVQLQVKYASDTDKIYEAIRGNQTDIISIPHNHSKAEKFRYIERGIFLEIPTNELKNYGDVFASLAKVKEINENNKVYAVPMALTA